MPGIDAVPGAPTTRSRRPSPVMSPRSIHAPAFAPGFVPFHVWSAPPVARLMSCAIAKVGNASAIAIAASRPRRKMISIFALPSCTAERLGQLACLDYLALGTAQAALLARGWLTSVRRRPATPPEGRRVLFRRISFSFLVLVCAAPARAERLCDPAHEDCRAILLNLIQSEVSGIDVAFWFMEDSHYSSAIIKRFQAGVPVRVLVDPRA